MEPPWSYAAGQKILDPFDLAKTAYNTWHCTEYEVLRIPYWDIIIIIHHIGKVIQLAPLCQGLSEQRWLDCPNAGVKRPVCEVPWTTSSREYVETGKKRIIYQHKLCFDNVCGPKQGTGTAVNGSLRVFRSDYLWSRKAKATYESRI